MARTLPLLFLVACVTTPKSTKSTTPPVQLEAKTPDCPLEFRFDARGASYERVSVAGEFNNWKSAQLELTDPDGDHVYTGSFDLPEVKPGRYSYKFVLSGASGEQWVLDPDNGREKVDGGQTNSLIEVADCALPQLTLQSAHTGQGTATIVASIGGAVDWASVKAMIGDESVPFTIDAATHTVSIALTGRSNKIGVVVTAANSAGALGRELYVPLWVDGSHFEFSDASLYFAFTDRFRNGRSDNDAVADCMPADSPTNWKGGDWKGITDAIDEGYFDRLGVNALWVSPINDNPSGCYSGSLAKTYTAYHGYSPVSLDQTEEHFGTAAELRTLVLHAHQHGIRVLADFVAKHLENESPLVAEHKDWFQPYYICGWDKPVQCWFEPYLPSFNYDTDAADVAVVDSAIGWIERNDLDGFRVDAAKHVGHGFIHNLRAEIADRIEHRQLAAGGKATYLAPQFYMVGETFDFSTGPIAEWISSLELSGQFDFPMWQNVLQSFAQQNHPLSDLKNYMQTQTTVFNGGVMSDFLDNHDVPRFITHADNLVSGYPTMDQTSDDATDGMGWSSTPPGQPADPRPYELMATGFAFINSQPEIPLIYYGDEIGLPGAGDPDNRRMMKWNEYTANQKALSTRYQSIGSLRRAHPALRSPTMEMSGLAPETDGRQDDTLAFFKTAAAKGDVLGEEILVVIDRRWQGSPETLPVYVPPRILPGTHFRDLETQEDFVTGAGAIDIPMGHPQARYLLRVP